MLLIKLSVEDERLIARATTPAELGGVRQMILDKINISKTLREMNKAPTVAQSKYLAWAPAWKIVNEVLGKGNVTMPPYPDNSWYARVNGVLKREGMSEESVRELAEFCKEALRKPVSFDFMICQQHRIRSGEFSVKKPPPPIELPTLPEPEED